MTLDAAAAPAPADPRDAAAKTAARQLEAFFLRRLLAEARSQGGGGIDGGFAGDTFKQMLDEAVADKVAAAGGIGLADVFAKQLGGRGATPAAPATPAGALPVPGPQGAHPVGHPGAELGPERAGLPRLALPVAGRVTSGYGMRADPIRQTEHLHAGFDLAAATGTPVAAAAAGTIVHAGPAGTYGNLVTIRHEDGFETRYAHLSAVGVAVGDRVEVGQPIGNVGSTGHSTGPHLHFELRRGGQPIDPAPLLPLNSSPGRTNR